MTNSRQALLLSRIALACVFCVSLTPASVALSQIDLTLARSTCEDRFSVRVKNQGSASATGTTVTFMLPLGSSMSFTTGSGWTCVGDTCGSTGCGTVLCRYGSTLAGQAYTNELNVYFNPPQVNVSSARVRVGVIANELDSEMTNNSLLEAKVYRKGDLDLTGSIDVFDTIDLQNFIVGNIEQGPPPFIAPVDAADINADGNFDVFDVVLLDGYKVGNVPCLPPTGGFQSAAAPSGTAKVGSFKATAASGGHALALTAELSGTTASSKPAGLGGYQASITFDPTVVKLVEVSAGASEGFTDPPVATNAEKANASGRVRIVGVHKKSGETSGQLSLGTVRFKEVKAGGASSIKGQFDALVTSAASGRAYAIPVEAGK